MCGTCGCGEPEGAEHEHTHEHGARGHGVLLAGAAPRRLIRLEQDILAKNNAAARENRARLGREGVFALNLISSPGSGKTTLLVESVRRLMATRSVAAVIGDQQTSRDADRLRATGVRALQINTGKGCHLDAAGVGRRLDELALGRGAVLFIENVGNLVCPAGFDLGEGKRVVLLSVTEGEDKPLKYPDAFRSADLMLLTKTDLLPHLDFDVAACVGYAKEINPRLEVLEVSAKQERGLSDWVAWIERHAFPLARAELR